MKLSEDARLLAALRREAAPLPASELALRAGLPVERLPERVAELRSAGFDVSLHPHLGYSLRGTSERLVADDLWSRFADYPEVGGILREIVVFAETSSTNDVAHRLGRDGAEGGVLVLAESQSAGRGRFGRKWESRPGLGIWLSLLLRPEWPVAIWPRLTTGTAVCAARALEAEVGVRANIKWPNDLHIQQRKVGGILIETGTDQRQQPYAVVGVGLNANHMPEDFPEELRDVATSLQIAGGRPVDRGALVVRFGCEMVRTWREAGADFAPILREAAARSSLLGHWVHARDGTNVWEGQAESLDDEGHLLLRTPGGELVRLMAGEVTLRH